MIETIKDKGGICSIQQPDTVQQIAKKTLQISELLGVTIINPKAAISKITQTLKRRKKGLEAASKRWNSKSKDKKDESQQ